MPSHFDKFMDDIVKRERAGRKKLEKYREGEDDKPQRKYNQLYREHPSNKISWGRKK